MGIYSGEDWARCQPASSTSTTTRSTTSRTTLSTTTTRTNTKDLANECAAPWEHFAEPGWLVPKCCTSGYTCVFANADWARCQRHGQNLRSFLAVHHALIQSNMSSIKYSVEQRALRDVQMENGFVVRSF